MQQTGMIIEFGGTQPPDGWLLCDGSDLPDGEAFDSLRTLVGDRVPDLRQQGKDGPIWPRPPRLTGGTIPSIGQLAKRVRRVIDQPRFCIHKIIKV